MGILDIFFKPQRISALQTGIASPWAPPSNLGGVVISEALGLELEKLPTGRAQAMTVPAIARGRHLIVSSIAQLPLVAVKDGTPIENQPTFLYRTDTGVTPAERVARTVDDLIFSGRSLWAVKRGAKGEVLDAAWIPLDRWSIDADSRILVDGKPVDALSVILFNGYTDGILNTAQRTIRGAIALEEAWVSKAATPIPLTVLEHVSGSSKDDQLEDAEIQDLLNQWRNARRDPDGALGYLPPQLRLSTPGTVDPQLLVEGRNAIRVDVASHLAMPALMLDGSVAEASLTYVTTEGNANRFWTETLPLYIAPIENALTAQATPSGTQVRFSMPELLTNPGSPIGAPESPAPTQALTTEEAPVE